MDLNHNGLGPYDNHVPRALCILNMIFEPIWLWNLFQIIKSPESSSLKGLSSGIFDRLLSEKAQVYT